MVAYHRANSLIAFLIALLLAGIVVAETPPRSGQQRLAYVFLNDVDTANSFKELLTEHEIDVDLIKLDEAAQTDFSSYRALIAANDVQKAWDSAIAKMIAKSGKPVLGLGEGGYYLFGRLHLKIGSPNGWHGGEVAVRPIKSDSTFWSTANFELPDELEAVLYAQSGQVGIHLPNPVEGVIAIGREVGSSTHYVILQQNKRYLLWGFDGSPAQMTTMGKQLFVHACRYLIDTSNEASTQILPAVVQASAGQVTQNVAGGTDENTTIRIPTEHGVLQINVAGPQVETVVADDGVTISDQAANRTYALRINDSSAPGSPALEVNETPSGIRFSGTNFQLTREGATVLAISLGDRTSASTVVQVTGPEAAASTAKCAIYLSCGSAGGPGHIYEMSLEGDEQKVIPLDAPAYGLVHTANSLLAAIPSVRVGEGKLLQLQAGVDAKPLEVDAELGAPIGLALDWETGDLLIPDNEKHTVVRVFAPEFKRAETLFRAPLTHPTDHFPGMSVAATKDRLVAFSASDPKGLFCLKLNAGEKLPESMLPADVGVAADPTSNRWVAMLDNELKVFQGTEEVRSIPCAEDATFWRYHVMAFSPDGRLFVVIDKGGALTIAEVDLQSGDLVTRFLWHGQQVVSMAAGPTLVQP